MPLSTSIAYIKNLKNNIIFILTIATISCLSGCGASPRILQYPVAPGGQSLNSSASELNPQISGKYIVFTTDRRGSQDVYLFDRINRKLIDVPGLNSYEAIASHPSISQDGKYIVFAASRQGKMNIFLYDRETRQSRNLTANIQAEVRNPTISADGSKIAFSSSINGQWDIRVYDRFGRPLNLP
ncbi:MAG: Tol biopolymer transporter periplasmic protein [Cyanobacteria bacterium P01_A01_bin.45]